MLASCITKSARSRVKYFLSGAVQRRFASKRNSAEEEKIVEENWKIRCDLATAYRALEWYGFSEGICNHLTAKAPSLIREEPIVLLVPYGLYWSEVTPECLIGLDTNTSTVVEGKGGAEASALSIHLGIYRNRADINSIMHTHPKYTTVMACLADPTMQMISQNSARYCKNVAYDFGYQGLSNDSVNNEGDRLGKAIGDKDILLMGNHGLTTTGKNVALAFDSTYYFERAAQTQMIAYQTGKPLIYLSDEVIEQTLQDLKDFDLSHLHLEGLKEAFTKRDPNFINRKNFNYETLMRN